MRDYLVATSQQAVDTGMPMVRPLAFMWPREGGALDRWDQWMLGEDLLVAPLWKSGARQRTVWLPPGQWRSFWHRGEGVEGPTEITVDVPLAMLPMWVRAGSDLLDLPVDEALAARIP